MIKYIVNLTVLITVIFLTIKGFSLYMTKDAKAFCHSIADDNSVAHIILKAESLGYHYFEKGIDEKVTKVVVSPQDSPFFRFSCVVTFKDNALQFKEVIADD